MTEKHKAKKKKERKLFSMTHVQEHNVHHMLTVLFCFFKGKRDSPRSISPESDLIPLNEYRRNRLMRLSEMLRDERNRFDDDLEEKRTAA